MKRGKKFKIVLFIVNSLSRLINLLLMSSVVWYIYTIGSSEITNGCRQSSIIDFDVEECSYDIAPSAKATIYQFDIYKVMTLQNLSSSNLEFIKKVFEHSIEKSKDIKSIEIIGDSNFISIGSNKAFSVKKDLIELGYSGSIIKVKENKDLFLNSINMRLNGTLLKVLKLEHKVKELKADLNILKKDNISQIREKYKRELEPYSSVVILVSFQGKKRI